MPQVATSVTLINSSKPASDTALFDALGTSTGRQLSNDHPWCSRMHKILALVPSPELVSVSL